MVAAAIVLAAAFAACMALGSRAIRVTLVLAMILSSLRGGLLDIFEELPVGNEDLFVNALGPGLIAAAALAAILLRRVVPPRLPVALAYVWSALLVVCLADFLTQDVGLKLYAIGIAQYLAYPTGAVIAWFELRRGEEQPLADLLLGIGIFVSLTLFVQALGITEFVQAVPHEDPGVGANRWAGITGSYLHTSAFLGPIAILAMALTIRGPSWRWPAASLVILSIVLSAQILTFSRSGVIISVAGAVVLLAFAGSMSKRLRLAGVIAVAVVIAGLAGTLSGIDPGEATGRIQSGLNPSTDRAGGADEGNVQRSEAMKAAVRRYRDTTLPKKVFGEGIGSTGNARKLIDEDPVPVESQYLKILVETGAFGVLLLFPFLIWVTLAFGWRAFRATDPLELAIGAAGFAYSLHMIIFPTLEVQIESMAWWVLFLLFLRTGKPQADTAAFLAGLRERRRRRGEPAPAST